MTKLPTLPKLPTLDQEEADILEAYEAGKTIPVADALGIWALHTDYPAATFRKDPRINIRLSPKDLRGLQRRALSEGMPYQTLVSSILHKYIEGRLSEQT